MSRRDLPESIEVLIFCIAIAIMVILFHGEPDVSDAIRAKALAWAGLEDVTTK